MQEQQSLASYFQSLPIEIRNQRADLLTDDERRMLMYDWEYWARPNQLPPMNKFWHIWMVLAGRGFGKTRIGAEYIRARVENGYRGRIYLIGPTAGDVRDYMVEGESGILAVSPPWNKPKYEPTKRKLTWPNGAIATTFSAEEPKRLRGPQCGLIWADELASWKYLTEAWDMAMFGFRKGTPKAVITMTPRPLPLVKDLLTTKGVVVTKGNTYENRANLAEVFFDTIIKKYEGTRLGEQEIHAKILEDTPGALWTYDNISLNRVTYEKFKSIELVKLAVAIDPAVTAKVTSNETGIVAGGIDADGEGYILADGSGIYSPIGWAKQAINIFAALKADRILAEVNNGGDMVEATLRSVSPQIPYAKVHASRGKRARAEPISALYERGLVHHVGVFPDLEDQMTTWGSTDGSDSPDRCFPTGTLINTFKGDKPIEQIEVNDMVLTRNGYRRVVESGQTSFSSSLLRLMLSCGIILECTLDHPIYVIGKGFIPAWTIKKNDQVLVIDSKLLSMKALNTEDIQTATVNQQAGISIPTKRATALTALQRCTGQYGKAITAQFQRVCTFITEMEISTIMKLETLRLSPLNNMVNITRMSLQKRAGSIWIKSDRLPQNGMGARKGLPGIKNTVKNHGMGERQTLKLSVLNAVNGLIVILRDVLKTDFAHASASIASITEPRNITKNAAVLFAETKSRSKKASNSKFVPVSVVGSCAAGKAPVYNLQVEGNHEYFANGILVHNCDALVWLLTWLMLNIKLKKATSRRG